MNKEEYEVMYHLEDSHWWYVGMRNIVDVILSDRLLNASRATRRVLDAGCGTGGMLQRLEGWRLAAGVDASEDALRFCQKRGLSALVLASVDDLPFASESFDAILSFDVLYHRNVQNDIAALREFRRLLKPGGVLLLRLPAYDWLRGSHDEAVHTRQRYNAGEVRQKMALAGFKVERITYANAMLFPLAAAKRLAEMVLGLHSGSDVKPVPSVANKALTAILTFEARLLRWIDLPWGLSVLALGRAVADGAQR